MWTSLTRATDFKNVTFFEHSQEEIFRLEESKLKQYVNLKINGYKTQDSLAKRKYYLYPFFKGEIYIDYEWFLNQDTKCHHCGINFYYELHNGSVCSNMSIDRENTTKCHMYDNCIMSCIDCNCSKY